MNQEARHPCFDAGARGRHARAHLPVAPSCNIRCGFCDRRHSCVNESRPGVTAAVMSPEDACAAFLRARALTPGLSVAGIAGPGDPLASARETLETLAILRRSAPDVLPCLSTNGLALPEHAAALVDLGVGHVTVTVNAATPETGARVWLQVRDGGRTLEGREGAALLMARQEEGIRLLAGSGVTVKINMVIIPGVNDHEAGDVARRAASWGASLMNCMGMIPVPGAPLGHLPGPDAETLRGIREQAERFLPQMRHCSRCRADAFGLLGEGRTLGEFAIPSGGCAAARVV